MPVFKLDKSRISFPDPALAEPDGLLAIEGDLSVDRLLLAYSHGIFPWYDEGEPIMWWCPRERFIIRQSKDEVCPGAYFSLRFSGSVSARNCF